MIVGVARPHATVSVPREEATIVLAIDVSRSMKATDVEPTRLDAARTAAKAFLAEVPEKFRVGVVSFATRAAVGVAPTEDRTLVEAALDSLTPGEGTAIGDAVALSLQVGQPQAETAEPPPPSAILLISDGARDGGRIDPAEAARKAKERGVPVYSVLVGTQDGVLEETLTGGLRRIIRVPPNPQTLEQIATSDGRRALRSGGHRGAEPRLRGSRLSAGHARRVARDHRRLRRSGGGAPARRGHDLGAALPEGSVTLVRVVSGARGPRRRARGGLASRGRERVRRPAWSASPSRAHGSSSPPRAACLVLGSSTSSTCPRGHVVGGLDARLSDRAIDVCFVGTLGSPVNPGITHVAVGRVRRDVRRGVGAGADASGRSSAACPVAGGGTRSTDLGRGVPARAADDAAREDRSCTARRRPPSSSAARLGERLVGASHAFGFATRTPPSASLVAERVGRDQAIRGREVVVKVRGDAELAACAHSSRFTRSARGRDELPEPVAAARPARPRARRRDLDARGAPQHALRGALHEPRRPRDRRLGALVAAATSRPRSFLLGLASLLVALARPEVERMLLKERATVILVVDTSRSMQAKDVEPTRLGAAQEALRTFLDQAPDGLAGRARRLRGRGAGGARRRRATTSSSRRRSTRSTVPRLRRHRDRRRSSTAVVLGRQVTGRATAGEEGQIAAASIPTATRTLAQATDV